MPRPRSFARFDVLRVRLLRIVVLGMLLASAGGVGGGCETISQDIEFLSRSLIPPSPREAAEMMVDQHNPDRRREGTLLITNAPFGGAEQYVELYRLMVESDPDPTVRAAAIRGLARHGTIEDAPLIADQLTHENVYVRWEAAKGLQRIHNPQVVGALLNVLRNDQEDSRVRVEAADALGQYPEDRVFQALLGALNTRELALNLRAAESLETLTGQSLGLDPLDWVAWYNVQPREERFARQQDYLFPTYSRDETLFEKLAFWYSPVFEQPAPPTGLRPASQRSTYPEEPPDAERDSDREGRG